MHSTYRGFSNILRYGYEITLDGKRISHCNPIHLSYTYANSLAQDIMRDLKAKYPEKDRDRITFRVTDSSAVLSTSY